MLYVHAGPIARKRRRSRARASTGSASATGSTSRSSTRRRGGGARRDLQEHQLEVRATERAARLDGVTPLDERIGHEWASDPERVSTVTIDLVDGLDDALRIANDETSGLAATIVDRGRGSRAGVPRRLPRHGGVLERADALHGRLRAARHARDGHQRRPGAGPARAGDVPRPLAPPVPRRRRRHAAPVTLVVKLGSTLVVDGRGRVRRSLLQARAAEVAELMRGGERVCVVSSGAIALGLAELGLARRADGRRRSCRPRPRSARRGCSARGRRRSRGTGW